MSTATETPEEALARIQSMGFGKNDAMAIMAFADRGIDPEEIEPRVNVLTFRGWKGAKRQVAKGAISVPVVVWIQGKGKKGKADETGEKKSNGFTFPKTTYLFHRSQTIELGAEKGTRPDAWENPALVREGIYEPQNEPETPAPLLINENGVEESIVEELEPETPTTDEFGKSGDDRPAECSCPMVGVITNVDCPLHGGR